MIQSHFSFFFLFFAAFCVTKVASLLGLPLLTCDLSCLTCTGPNANQCVTCLSGLLPVGSSCVCPDGKYFAGGLTSCQNCDTSCSTCNGANTNNCLSCPANSQIYGGTCYPQCTSTQYFNTNTLSCASCNTYCQTCSGPASNQCTSCTSATLTSGSCRCATGNYVTPLGGCTTCYSGCKDCSGPSSNQCTACISGMVLQNSQCLCSTGTYLVSGTTNTCQSCYPMCKGCSGPSASSCTSCNNNLYVVLGQCKCPASTYYNPSSQSCLACSSRCSSCTGPNTNQCTACKNNLAVTSPPGQCTCPSGSYLDTGVPACVSCDTSCLECSGSSATSCTTCPTGYTLSGGQCLCSGSSCSCASGFYFNTISQKCEACDLSCQDCLGPSNTECSNCRGDYTFSSGQCICPTTSCSCGIREYFNGGISKCASCHNTCANCSGGASNQCQSCISGLTLSSSSCNCPTGKYLDSSLLCFDCDSSCGACSGPSSTQCTQCINSLVLSNGACTCPTGKYFDLGTSTCLSCDSTCQDCTGPEISQCTACQSGELLHQGYCVDWCTSNEYWGIDFSCQPCDSSCLTCSGDQANECLSCPTGSRVSFGICIKINTNQCSYGCESCKSPSRIDCYTCDLNLLLVLDQYTYGYCTSQCPTDYYYVQEDSQIICRPKIGLDNTLVYGPELNQIELLFGKDITPFLKDLYNAIEIGIDFRADQPPINFTYTLEITPSSKSLMLNLTFHGHLLPRNVLKIAYNFPLEGDSDNTSSIYVARQLLSVRLIEYFNYTPGVWTFVETSSKVNSVGLQANVIFSWTSSVFFQGIHSLRSEIVEDMIGYFIFMDIDYTPNFIKFAEENLNALEVIMPNIFEKALTTEQESQRILQENYVVPTRSRGMLKRYLYHRRMEQQSRALNHHKGRMLQDEQGANVIDEYFDNREFLANHGAATSVVVIGLAIVVAIEVIRFIMGKINCLPRVLKVLDYISVAFRWNFVLTHFCSEFQGFIFFGTLQLASHYQFNNSGSYLNYIFAGISLFMSTLGIVGLIFLMRLTFKKTELRKYAIPAEIKKLDSFLNRIRILHSAFNKEWFSQLLYPILMMLRCLGFGFLLAFGLTVPLEQLIYLVITTFGILGYVIYYKPFEHRLQLVLTILYEILFLGVIITTLVLHIYSQNGITDIQTRSTFCMGLIGFSMVMVVLDIISFGFELYEATMKCLRRRRIMRNVIPFIKIPMVTRSATTITSSTLQSCASSTPNLATKEDMESPKKGERRIFTASFKRRRSTKKFSGKSDTSEPEKRRTPDILTDGESIKASDLLIHIKPARDMIFIKKSTFSPSYSSPIRQPEEEGQEAASLKSSRKPIVWVLDSESIRPGQSIGDIDHKKSQTRVFDKFEALKDDSQKNSHRQSQTKVFDRFEALKDDSRRNSDRKSQTRIFDRPEALKNDSQINLETEKSRTIKEERDKARDREEDRRLESLVFEDNDQVVNMTPVGSLNDCKRVSLNIIREKGRDRVKSRFMLASTQKIDFNPVNSSMNLKLDLSISNSVNCNLTFNEEANSDCNTLKAPKMLSRNNIIERSLEE